MTHNIDQSEMNIPVDVQMRHGVLQVVLCRLPKTTLKEPFFIDSLAVRFNIATVNKVIDTEQIVLVRPLHFDETDDRISYVSAEEFCHEYEQLPLRQDSTKFIFHMSRCGSTLVTQMLATCERLYIISESTAVNAALNPDLQISVDERDRLIRSILNSLYASRPDQCDVLIVKFRSWNIFYQQDILRLYPEVQWMFVHRNGSEVLESVLRDPPGWLRSRHTDRDFFAKKLDVSATELDALKDNEYATRILGAFCAEVARNASGHSTFLDYVDIKTKLPSIVNEQWGLNLSTEEIGAMIEHTTIYSKDPSKRAVFVPDSEKKQELISEESHAYADALVETRRRVLNQITAQTE